MQATELSESKFFPGCVRAVREHECGSYPDCNQTKEHCEGADNDYRVKWAGWLLQYSTWEKDKDFNVFGQGLLSNKSWTKHA
jgi:hypothetical protein